MVDYSKGVIYKIKRYDDENDEMILVGSTCDLRKRGWGYKSQSNNPNGKYYNIPSHKFIRDNGGWSNFVMEKLEDYPLRKKKYRQNNPEKIKERYENNKEEIQAKRSIKINCDNCNALVSKSHIARHKKSLKCINYSSSGSGATCSSISLINTDGVNTDLPITGSVNDSSG